MILILYIYIYIYIYIYVIAIAFVAFERFEIHGIRCKTKSGMTCFIFFEMVFAQTDVKRKRARHFACLV